MSQEIGPVTPCHAMSLVVTLTKDCASPVQDSLLPSVIVSFSMVNDKMCWHAPYAWNMTASNGDVKIFHLNIIPG